MKILATDLDRTLLPNGHWEYDRDAIEQFNRLTIENDVLVVYVTGRSLTLTERAIAEFGVRYPDVLCSDVGAYIRSYENGEWSNDEGWINRVSRCNPRWNPRAIRKTISKINGIEEQESEHLNQFKQSYYVNHEKHELILKNICGLIKGKFDEEIIYSFDSQNGRGLLDFLPNSATKKTALEYLAEKFNVTHRDIVFCGDSGNDIAPLTAGFRGVVVKNADAQLLENVNKAIKQFPTLNIYFAQGGFKGLNGYYTSGVIEGAYHYGIFK